MSGLYDTRATRSELEYSLINCQNERAILQKTNADLLAALEAMLEYDTGTPDDVLKQARAALAKAKGQQ